ncbi:putative pyruvate dehydrogenase (acetyl-transferring) [Helianthus anomalus]
MDDGSNRIGGRADQSWLRMRWRHELLLFEALREGLEEEMERDARVCVMGAAAEPHTRQRCRPTPFKFALYMYRIIEKIRVTPLFFYERHHCFFYK